MASSRPPRRIAMVQLILGATILVSTCAFVPNLPKRIERMRYLSPANSFTSTTGTYMSTAPSAIPISEDNDAASQNEQELKIDAVFVEKELQNEQSSSKATIPNLTVSLVKSVVGAGVLSLPAGIAAFGDAPSALLPAMALITVIGGLSAYSYLLLGRAASQSKSSTFSETWDKSVGAKTAWVPAAVGTVDSFITNMAYSMILADTFCALLKTIGYTTITRTQTLLGITGVALLPLCLLKDLSSLAPFSALGSAGMMYTSVVMAIRYFGGGYVVPGGKFLANVASNMKPVFGTRGAKSVLSPNAFILICMLSTAFNAHFNAPKFYDSLQNTSVKRFTKVVTSSFAISMGIFSFIAGMGFLTFGRSCNGFILNNYSTADTLMGISRLAVALSILFSYPIIFAGVMDGVFDMVGLSKEKRTNTVRNAVTISLLSILTFLASKFTDLGMIVSILGATFGNVLVYIFPSIMFRSSVKKMGVNASKSLKREAKLGLAIIAMGLGFGGVGVRMAMLGLA